MRTPIVLGLITATAITLSPSAALAHAKLVSSRPVANSVAVKPSRIVMTFNEKLTGASVKVELFMTAMAAGMSHDGKMDHSKMDHAKMQAGGMADHAPIKIAAIAQLGKDGMSVGLTPKRALAAGRYKVSWSASGADGHLVSGNFSFAVK